MYFVILGMQLHIQSTAEATQLHAIFCKKTHFFFDINNGTGCLIIIVVNNKHIGMYISGNLFRI